MSTTQQLLLLAVGALAVWQVVLFGAFIAMFASGKYNKIRVGVGPGLAALVLLVIFILL